MSAANKKQRTDKPQSSTYGENVKVIKAYKSADFLNSREARPIRILCEYQDTEKRLKEEGVKGTILVFGSARCYSTEAHALEIKKCEEALTAAKGGPGEQAASSKLSRMRSLHWMCEYGEKISQLTQLITEWALTPEAEACIRQIQAVDEDALPTEEKPTIQKQSLVVCTGGGPGLMESANRGAARVTGGRSIGMGISLPFETGLNRYVSPELAFEYHYFFTRKFWMVYACCGLVVAPGGYGTLDELFEVLTLKQTGKIKKDLPVVLFGKEYWKSVINFEKLAEYGTIAWSDIDKLHFCDTAQEAFEVLVKGIKGLVQEEIEMQRKMETESNLSTA